MNRAKIQIVFLLMAMLLMLSCAHRGGLNSGRVDPAGADVRNAQRSLIYWALGDRSLTAAFAYKYSFIYNLTALTMLDFNSENTEFKAIFLSPMGMNILELKADAESIHNSSSVLKDTEGMAIVAARDIRRIYLDLRPDSAARIYKKDYTYQSVEYNDIGKMVREFNVSGMPSMRKTQYKDGKPLWRVSYSDYMMFGREPYPITIELRDFKAGYSLQIYLKEAVRNYE
jgi:hypothetical protein